MVIYNEIKRLMMKALKIITILFTIFTFYSFVTDMMAARYAWAALMFALTLMNVNSLRQLMNDWDGENGSR